MTDTTPELERLYEPITVLAPDDWPNIDDLVTEDDTPVDNLLSEKQQRLLTESLYTSWAGPGENRPFLAAANVGLFASLQHILVPDMFLSLDVAVPESFYEKRHRSYFFWEFGKSPELVIEIVSNRKGGEASFKMQGYARMGITYYVIYDPLEQLSSNVLRAYALSLQRTYIETTPELFVGVGLGLALWQGAYEGQEDTWLRWQDAEGHLILTGAESKVQAEQRAGEERQRADEERQRADEERQRAERLLAQLRALGVEPDDNGEG